MDRESCFAHGDFIWVIALIFCGYQNRYHNSPDFFKQTVKTYVLQTIGIK